MREIEEDEHCILEFRGHRFRIAVCHRPSEPYERVDLWRDEQWENRAALRVPEAAIKFRRGIEWALGYAYEHEEGARG